MMRCRRLEIRRQAVLGRAPRARTLRCAALCLLAAVIACGGCGLRIPAEMDSEYGDLRSRRAKKTVDGVDALAQLFRDYDYQVRRWRRLSPRLVGRERMDDERRDSSAVDVILWAPDRLAPLAAEQYEFLGRFVDEGGTLVIVGRDYDPLADYWQRTQVDYQDDYFGDAVREGMLDRASHLVRVEQSLPYQTPWYDLDFQPGAPLVTQLRGPWSRDIDVEATRILCHVKLTPFERAVPEDNDAQASNDEGETESSNEDSESETNGESDGGSSTDGSDETADPDRDLREWSRYAPKILRYPQAEVLLDSDRGPLVVRFRAAADAHRVGEDAPLNWDLETHDAVEPTPGQVLVVTNGSFLLNLGLLPNGNRQLAERLLMECGQGRTAVVMDPESEMVRVYDVEPNAQHIPPRHEPLATIIDHIAVLGVVACFVVFPIFGRPKVHPAPPLSDIEEHIEAVATLMAKSHDTGYAKRKVDHYQSLIQRDDRSNPP